MTLDRRKFLVLAAAAPAVALAPSAWAQSSDLWSARQARQGLESDEIVLIDIRSRREWQQTGLAQGAWPISMHEEGFSDRLLKAHSLAGDRRIALICAAGGRSARIHRLATNAGMTGLIDVSEGMMGSRRGKGWIESGLPTVTLDAALEALPADLK